MSTPDPWSDDRLIDHIGQGGDPDDDLARDLAALRDRGQDDK